MSMLICPIPVWYPSCSQTCNSLVDSLPEWCTANIWAKPQEHLMIWLPPWTTTATLVSCNDSQMMSNPFELPTTELELDTSVLTTPDNPTNNSLENPQDSEEEEERGGLLDEVDKLLKVDDSGVSNDEDDGREWEEGETPPLYPNCIFCPSPHHKPILHLFTKYFCQHPLFPKHRGSSLNAAAIHRQAVSEMYQSCYQRGLCEVWGYLWTSWYALKIWKLWACSTSPYVSWLHTTMGAESFWQ